MLAALLGTVVGLILALTGAGGAIIAVPLLIFTLHWSVAQAAPVALLAVAVSATAGVLLGLRQGVVRYRAALFMAGLGSLMTPIGLSIAHQLPPLALTLVFSAVLGGVSLRMLRQASGRVAKIDDLQLHAECRLNSETGRFDWTEPCARALARAGLLTGFLSGLLGVGGGFLIVPSLKRATDLPMNSIVATSLMVIALVSGSAVAVSAFAGNLDVSVALPFTGGALIAMLAGRLLAERLAGPRLQQGFAVLAGLIAVCLALKALLMLS